MIISPFSPKWIYIANAEMGVKEVAGAKNNPRILEYHKATSLQASDDETPWCSAFVNWCMMKANLKGSGEANARSWLKWGVEITEPAYGCIVVLQRGENSWQGHVGFLIGFSDQDKLILLAGNQGDAVSLASFPRNKVLGYRWI